MNNNYFSQIWMNNNNFSCFRSIVKIRHFRLLCLVRMERKTNWKLTIKSQKRKLFYFLTIIVLLLNTPKIITHIFKFSYIFKQFDENLLILCTLVVWVRTSHQDLNAWAALRQESRDRWHTVLHHGRSRICKLLRR